MSEPTDRPPVGRTVRAAFDSSMVLGPGGFMKEPAKDPEAYLGDGVYAVCDGTAITLDLRGQDDTTRIALDADTWNALRAFAERCGW
jgi:hypothetical protein